MLVIASRKEACKIFYVQIQLLVGSLSRPAHPLFLEPPPNVNSDVLLHCAGAVTFVCSVVQTVPIGKNIIQQVRLLLH